MNFITLPKIRQVVDLEVESQLAKIVQIDSYLAPSPDFHFNSFFVLQGIFIFIIIKPLFAILSARWRYLILYLDHGHLTANSRTSEMSLTLNFCSESV